MRSSVRVQTEDSIKAYATVERPKWVREWPAMVVLAVSAIYWSKECEDSIKGEREGRALDRVDEDKRCGVMG